MFTGELGGTELAQAYASLDVFVHPGEHETFCQAVQESLSSSVPVIGPDAGGPRDLVSHCRNGYLLPVDRFSELLPSAVSALDLDEQFGPKVVPESGMWNSPGSRLARTVWLSTHRRGSTLKVLVAGATSVPGIPVIRELVTQGYDVVGVTRSVGKTSQVEKAGARPIVGDVFDKQKIGAIVSDESPEVVISLLTTLPKNGPLRMGSFKNAIKLWGEGVPNLLAAAQRSGCRRMIAESMIFAYGYGQWSEPLDESDPNPGPPPPGKNGQHMLDTLRRMEQAVLQSGKASGTEGIVLRYGGFHGPTVTHTQFMARLAKLWMMPVPTGGGLLSWVELGDVAKATVAAVDHGRGGEMYNIVDDHPVSFREYMNDFAAALRRRKPVSMPRSLVSLGAPYIAVAFGTTQLPVSNAKAKRELGWMPEYPDHKSAIATFT